MSTEFRSLITTLFNNPSATTIKPAFPSVAVGNLGATIFTIAPYNILSLKPSSRREAVLKIEPRRHFLKLKPSRKDKEASVSLYPSRKKENGRHLRLIGRRFHGFSVNSARRFDNK
ncbi:hypothetical protein NC652_018082 [Populus alba x Populus x berolinensis]|nr:hypothetical protein NC652_018082 [Populus alba x Populus x berolinensis]